MKYYDGPFPPEYILNHQDLIVTMTDLSKQGDTLGYPALAPQIPEKFLLHNQRIGKVGFKTNNELKSYIYLVMCQNDYRHFVLGSATGTTVRHSSPGRICDYKLIMPTYDVLKAFNGAIRALIENDGHIYAQNVVLSEIRDTLLPKLLSGGIKV